jgi:hypothetical protein
MLYVCGVSFMVLKNGILNDDCSLYDNFWLVFILFKLFFLNVVYGLSSYILLILVLHFFFYLLLLILHKLIFKLIFIFILNSWSIFCIEYLSIYILCCYYIYVILFYALYILLNIFLFYLCNFITCALSFVWILTPFYISRFSLFIIDYCCYILHYKNAIWFLYLNIF